MSPRLIDLFTRYHKGTASASETEELMKGLRQLPDETISALLKQTWQEQPFDQTFFTSATREKLLEQLRAAEDKGAPVHRMQTGQRFRFLTIAAAAAILIVVSVSVFMLLNTGRQSEMAQAPAIEKTRQDIAPGGDRATLTLADGTVVILDSAAKGRLTDQGGTKVINLEGQLAYEAGGQTTEVLYNTISTPKGGQYQLVLADGSKVWLNAASSIRFPTAFPGNERQVEIQGEAYFEVAHNAAKPFHVKVGEMDVRVLGTSFNVNSYDDEPVIKTTLLEGRVMVKKNGKEVYLNPGQQAIVQPGNDNIRINYDVELEQVVAWKNGRFYFNSADIQTIMRQAERWYDVEVIYKSKIDETFSGGMPRSENISQLLKIMEATDKVDFEIKGKQVIVKPK